MFTDIKGKKRLKVGLHTHTTCSDGSRSPEEAICLYEAAGYDVIAITDHWHYGETYKTSGISVISGCEYHVIGFQPGSDVKETFHIVGIGMMHDPKIPRELIDDDSKCVHKRVQTIVRMIRESGGIAVLAHPAWSLNTQEQILSAGDFDAIEIYNSVSECGMSDRPYSGLIVDMLAVRGVILPLLATDDTHYYKGDECRGMVMVESEATEELGLIGAIRDGRFYATQGPEVHLERIAPDKVKLSCSPAEKIVFFSNLQWASGRVIRGKQLTEAIYTLKTEQQESYVRAEVVDENGLKGWSNIIVK